MSFPPTLRRGASRNFSYRLVATVVVVLVAVAAWWWFRDELDLQRLSRREAQLRGWQAAHPLPLVAAAFLIYVATAALCLPFGTALTICYGWLFGFWTTVVVVSFASTSGATLSMLICRYLLREPARRWLGDRGQRLQQALDRHGAWYLLTLRLLPGIPFFVLNPLMGLTRIPTWTYWWVSQVGMFPATLVYTYAGAQLPRLETIAARGVRGVLTPGVVAALALLAVFPWVMRLAIRSIRPPAPESPV